MSKKNFTIEVSSDFLMKRLKSALGTEPHADLIAEMIIGNLSLTEIGLSQLYTAFSGFVEKIPFMVGDEIMFSESKLYSWHTDKSAMIEKGLIVNGMVKGVITSINIHKLRSIMVTYDGVKNGIVVKVEDDIKAEDAVRDDNCLLARQNVADII